MPTPARRETFSASHTRIKEYLGSHGWSVVTKHKHTGAPLVLTYAEKETTRGNSVRLWFKPQAVYMTHGNDHRIGNARSLVTDPRGMSVYDFVAMVDLFTPRLP